MKSHVTCEDFVGRAKTLSNKWRASRHDVVDSLWDSGGGGGDDDDDDDAGVDFSDQNASIMLEVEADVEEDDIEKKIGLSVTVRFGINIESLTGVLKRVCEKDELSDSACRSLTCEIRLLRAWITMRRPETIAVREEWKHVRRVKSWTHSKGSSNFFSHIPAMMWPPPTRDLALSELMAETDVARDVAIIVPYRDRKIHLDEFVRHMTRTLGMTDSSDRQISGFDGGTGSKKRTTYVVIIVEQNNDAPFNRGWLMNVGFHLATVNRISTTTAYRDFSSTSTTTASRESSWRKPHSVVFHDVDILPAGDVVPFYARSPPPGCVFHLINPLWPVGPRLMYSSYGGVNAFRSEDFAAINGFPNDRFGWGLEDDCLRQRATIHRPESYTTLRPTEGHFTFLSHNSNRNDTALATYAGVLGADLRDWRSNGLSSLEYGVDSVELIAPGVAKIKVRSAAVKP
eukprot:g764.t1